MLRPLVLLVLVSSAFGQQGFNWGGFLKFAAKETAKAVGSQTQGQLRVSNPVSTLTQALRPNSGQKITIGTPFGNFNIGGGQKTTAAPSTAATVPPTTATTTTTTTTTTPPPTAVTAQPCRGRRRCRPSQTGGATSGQQPGSTGGSFQIYAGCGVNYRSIGTRIVGGQAADPRAWPWMVALLRGTPDAYCGGVLISQRHVLTAAHCVQSFKPREIRVRLGVYEFTNDTLTAGQPIRRVRIHPRYEPFSYRYDAAILTLERPAELGESVRPVCLPQPGQSYQDTRATVTGWGTIYSGGPTSSVLQQLTVPVWGQAECDAAYPQNIDGVFLCAGGRRGGRDACQGDSGGPLQYRRPDGTWSVIGIVSWGKKCAEPGYPGVYTRVTELLDWVRRRTGN